MLTHRELIVKAYLKLGYDDREIANALEISTKQVSLVKNRILIKEGKFI